MQIIIHLYIADFHKWERATTSVGAFSVRSELDREMINYRAIFLVKSWINMFSISVAVYKQETGTLAKIWLKKNKTPQHSIHLNILCRKDLYIPTVRRVVIKWLLNILIRPKGSKTTAKLPFALLLFQLSICHRKPGSLIHCKKTSSWQFSMWPPAMKFNPTPPQGKQMISNPGLNMLWSLQVPVFPEQVQMWSGLLNVFVSLGISAEPNANSNWNQLL